MAACTSDTSPGKPEEPAGAVFGSAPLSLPLVIDTTFILKADTTKKLSYQEVRQMGMRLFANEATEGFQQSIHDFCRIDSLKQNKGYGRYVDSLNIGMTRDAIAFKLGYAPLKNNAVLFLWGIVYSSYEACPVFSGTRIIGSYRGAGNQYTHALLGEISSWTDPPSSYALVVTTAIGADGTFTSKSMGVSDDMDVTGQDSTLTELRVEMSTEGFKRLAFNKRVHATEKPE